jgi:hypothetical protein
MIEVKGLARAPGKKKKVLGHVKRGNLNINIGPTV